MNKYKEAELKKVENYYNKNNMFGMQKFIELDDYSKDDEEDERTPD